MELAEKIEIEAKEIVLNHPKNQIDELASFLSCKKLRGNATLDTFNTGGDPSFLQNRGDVIEVFIIDASGMEKGARVA